ncbi:MAG: glycosyltransferase family 39 protein [Dehalococcoidia bacterium]
MSQVPTGGHLRASIPSTLLVLIVTCGAALRLVPALTHEFPLRDGGMFVVMVGDLLDARFALPEVTSYNQLDIPFVYPPLPFYLAAMLASVLGQPPIEVLRWLPALLATSTVPALYIASREVLRSHRWPYGPAVATFAYAVSPRAFDWLIAAGGLTRALGTFFALLALERTLVALRTDRRRAQLEAGTVAGLTALSHPQAAIFLVASVLVLGLFDLRTGAVSPVQAARRLAGATAIATVVVLPWVLVLASRGRLDALLGIGGRWSPTMDLSSLTSLPFTPGGHFNVGGAFALLLLLSNTVRGDLRLPSWILLTVVLGVGGGGFLLEVPTAVMLGDFAARSASRPAPRYIQVAAAIAGAALGLMALTIAVEEYTLPSSRPFQLSPDARAAIEWSGANLEPGSGVVTITRTGWGSDLAAEWLPALTDLRGATTVQGSEWLGRERWSHRVDASTRVNRCAVSDAACLDTALATLDVPVQAVLILGPPDGLDSVPLVESLKTNAGYRLAFESGNVRVFTVPSRP